MFTWSSRLGLAVLLSVLCLLAVPGRTRAQDPSLSPDSLGAEFQAALQGMGWRAAAHRMHPEALRRFRYLIDVFVTTDETPITREFFFGTLDQDEYRSMSDELIFIRVMSVMMSELRGLLHAIVVRDVRVIGSVQEPPDLAHVVYRSLARLSGAEPEMRIMTLKRAPNGWRVLESQELDVIMESLRGTPRRLRPDPP